MAPAKRPLPPLPTRVEVALPPWAKATVQRQAVVDAITVWDGSFTVVELFDRARRAHPTLSLATTYRTVDILRRAGSIHSLPGESHSYVRCSPAHHHHLVCVSCGSVEETDLCSAPSAAEVKRRHGFAAQAHEADIYGLCARCA
jgi:Fe2+ or Zn2+ uptake regulation protein